MITVALFGFVNLAIYITITMEETKELTSIYTYILSIKQWPESTLVKFGRHDDHNVLFSCSVKSRNSVDQAQYLNIKKESHFLKLYLPCYY